MADLRRPSFYISLEHFDECCASSGIYINDLPPEKARFLAPHFDNEDTLAVFASGFLPVIEGHAGIDWIRSESDPVPGEPELNIYRFEIGPKKDGRYPAYGPIKTSADGSPPLAAHWSTLSDLEVYLRRVL